GIFDEHAGKSSTERRAGESACSLVIKVLQLENHPVYAFVNKLVTEADNHGVHPLHLANRIKTKFRLGYPPSEVVAYALEELQDLMQEQELFVQAKEFLSEMVRRPNNCRIISKDGK